jgi:hypothetical protein
MRDPERLRGIRSDSEGSGANSERSGANSEGSGANSKRSGATPSDPERTPEIRSETPRDPERTPRDPERTPGIRDADPGIRSELRRSGATFASCRPETKPIEHSPFTYHKHHHIMGTTIIPRSNSPFDQYIRNTTTVLGTMSPPPGPVLGWQRLLLTTTEHDSWVDFRDKWAIVYPQYTDLAQRTKSITKDKNDLRDAFIAFAQPLLARIGSSPDITSADRETFNLPETGHYGDRAFCDT